MPPLEMPPYLNPDFDPWSIKMDTIRDILIQHHVRPPTGVVRKQQLVDLFNEHIRPQVPELRSIHEGIVPNDDDIIHVPSVPSKSRHRSNNESERESSSSTKPARMRRSSSKQNMALEDAPVEVKSRRSNSRIQAEKTDSEPESRGRKPRKSIAQSEDDSEPVAKITRRKKTHGHHADSKSGNFSSENPFQSGSESERRRSRSRDKTAKPTRSSSRSRRTEKKVDHESDSTAHVFKVPAQPAFSKFMQTPEKSEPGPSYSSPSKTRIRQMSASTLPPAKTLNIWHAQEDEDSISKLPFNIPPFGPLWVLLSALLLSYGAWYSKERFAVGFCPSADNLGHDTTSANGGWFYPSCIPCPDHATCIGPKAEPICPPEYMLKPHLLSFGNILPLSPVCVLNRAKEYQSLQVADAAEKLLHLRAGREECNIYNRLSSSKELWAKQRMPVEALKQELELLKDASVSHLEFDQFWLLALKELHRRTEKLVFEDGSETVRSLKPQKSFGCRIRQALVGWLVQFKFFLFALVSTVVGGLWFRNYMFKRRKENRIVNGLVQNVLTKLSDQAHYYYVDPALYPDPFLAQTHLRDALLADVHSSARRQEIWEKVRQLVENNSNVRIGSQEVRGEPHRTWEWVGASGVLNHRTSGGPSGTPRVPPRTGPHGSYFGMTRQDSEFMNPVNPLYPSLSQDYSALSQE